MTIKETHDTILFVIKKTRNEFVSHEDIDRALDIAQMSLFAELIGNYRRYPEQAMVNSGRLLSDLNPFRERQQFLPGDYNSTTDPFALDDGILVLPVDFLYFDGDGAYSVVMDGSNARNRPIEILPYDEFAERSDSSLSPPTVTDPIGVFDGKGGTVNSVDIGEKMKLRLLPDAISGFIVYFRRPLLPVYAYTVVDRVETYDSAASVHLEWNDNCAHVIIKKALQTLGATTEDMVVLQEMVREESTSQ